MSDQTHLENLRKQIHISNKIDIIMEQSLKLMDIVNENQKAVNELKEEQEQLKTHTDNSTDQMDNDGSVADNIEA
mgnify:CR=1 FL=1